MKKHISTIVCWLITATAFAAWQAPIVNYASKEYNAGTQNWYIFQHPNGWMYFGNNYGLLEFDGMSWEIYGIWNSSVVRSIAVDEEGDIYVGGSNEYGKFVANPRGGLTYAPLSGGIPEQYKMFGEAWNILLLHKNLYVQTHNYIFIQTPEGEVSVVEPKSHIYCSAKIRNGIYLATADGIYLMTGTELNALRGSDLLKDKVIRSMQPYGPSGMLIATDFHGLYLFNGEEIVPFPTEADSFMRQNELYSIAVNDKYIAVGTIMDGTVIMDAHGKNCRYINNLNGLQNNTVLSLEFDRYGNLWLGLDQGVSRIFLDSPIENLYGNINSKGAGYTCCLEGSTIYMGTNQGLYMKDYPFNKSERLTELTLVKGSSGQVWDIQRIDNDLFCCHNRGLFLIRGDRLVPVSDVDGFWTVRAMPGTKDKAIGGTYNGMYLLEKENGTWKIRHKIKGTSSTARLFQINRDHIWMITVNGVEDMVLNEAMDSVACRVAVPANPGGNDYFSIFRIDDQIIISGNKHCQAVNADNQLVRNDAFFEKMDGDILYSCIATDDHGNIWYIAGESLRVCPYNNKTSNYEKSMEVCNISGFFIGGFAFLLPVGNNQAIVSNIYGFALADMDAAINRKTHFEKSTHIRKIRSINSKDSLLFGDSYRRVNDDLRIPYALNSLRFESTGSFDSSEPLQFSYQLEPLDNNFSEWTENNSKDYTHLREGSYTFHVRSRAGGGGTISEATVSFRVLPPWYRSWWSYVIRILLALAVIYAIYYYFHQRVERSKQKLSMEKDAEMRAKELLFAEEAHQREKKILQLQNEHIELELKNKSQELANVTLNRLNKNEILADIKNDLKKIQADLQAQNLEGATRKAMLLQNKLTGNIEQDVDWKQFEENFDIVHAHFLQKLTETYPWLNKKERKLCVYIRMGLLTKEIAPLMNMSTRGVEMLRYRMRKRMELGRSEDLESYFQTFAVDGPENAVAPTINNIQEEEPEA
ncbi:MAG: hypothetical protein J6Z12_01695 [Paludibacteraceae bacterium]|nr:hypothetical protein [Paludibacteraceae bacterium]